MPTAFLERVKSTIKRHNMLKPRDRILVGLSGGPDSVVLLYVLNMIKAEYGLDIHIAHLDHKFRGEESKTDRLFCEALAEKLDLEIISEEIDVPEIAGMKKISPEEAARQERYGFFKRIAEAKHLDKIAVGHNKDDQAETVLMRILRGAGMSGMGGMIPVKEMYGFIVIRPLIEVSRKDIEGFIRESGLEFRHDSSNDETVYTRNKVRRDLMPYLEKNFNANIKEVLVNMAENLREENSFLEKVAKRKFKSMAAVKKAEEIVLDIKKFKKQEEAVKKRILRCALREIKGDLRRFTYQHWKEMEDLIDNRPVNSIVDLPGDIKFIKSRKGLIVQRG
jgi:tRNA(Ile)-lysidine synthase